MKSNSPVPESEENAIGMVGGAYTPPSVSLARKPKRRWIWIGCILLVLVAALHSANESIGGGDTWVAMACGRYTLGPWAKEHSGRTWQMKVLDRFGIHTTQHDPFGAYTREFNPDSGTFKNILIRSWGAFQKAIASEEEKAEQKQYYDPALDNVGWVNQNWLTHVMFYKMKTAFGGDEYQPQKGEFLIVIYKFVQAILTALFVYWAARVMGAHPLLAASAVAFGILLSRSFIDLRPNVSSIFFAAIMILLIGYWKQGRRWALAGMIPVMILWSNVHGGFIYAIMIFVTLLIGYTIQNYAGRANYAFLLLGFATVFIVLLSGVGDLQEEANTTAVTISQAASITAAILILGIVLLSVLRPDHLRAESYVQVGKPRLTFLAGSTVLVTLIPAVFSPFGWENLVHPLLVATGEEGKQWREVIEWKPIWDTNGFGHATPYVYFLILFGVVMLVWWVLFFFKPKTAVPPRQRRKKTFESFPWPKIDLAQIAIIAVTLAMSVKSRRFIFLGGVILAPYCAVFAQEVIHMARLLWRQKHQHPLQLTPMPKKWARALALGVLVPVGIIGWLFHSHMDTTYDYLHRTEAKESSLPLFRRMVRVIAQPVDIMPWFRDYNLNGIVFNNWTQGGFIAYHQKPDPQTGMPPCKLYIDGRAQAAYSIDHYKHWISVSSMPIKKKWDPKRFKNLTPKLYANLLEKEGINAALVFLRGPKEIEIVQFLIDSNRWIPVRQVRLDGNGSYYLLLCVDDPRNFDPLKQALLHQPKILLAIAVKHTQSFTRIFSDAPKALAQTFLKNTDEFRYLALKETQTFERIFNENLPALNQIFLQKPTWIPEICHSNHLMLKRLYQSRPDGLRDVLTEHAQVRRYLLVYQFDLLNDLFRTDTAFWAELSKEKLLLDQKKHTQLSRTPNAPPSSKVKQGD